MRPTRRITWISVWLIKVEKITWKTPLVSGRPVALSLDAVTRVFLSVQWFERRNWYDHAIKTPQLQIHSLPNGLVVKPPTYHTLPAHWSGFANPATFLVFVGGAADGIRGAWSVVVAAATDGWSQHLVGCQIHTAIDHSAWYGATECDNLTAEFSAYLMAQNWIFNIEMIMEGLSSCLALC